MVVIIKNTLLLARRKSQKKLQNYVSGNCFVIISARMVLVLLVAEQIDNTWENRIETRNTELCGL